jgi:hypothetical protein
MKIIVIFICFLASAASGYAQLSELWRKSYTQGITSSIRSYTTDNSGNYIIGAAADRSAPNFSDFAVIKFNAEGDTVWRRDFHSRDGFQDHLWDVHADNSGNVYVTGVSTNYGSETTLRTLKYSNSGVLLWQKTDSLEVKQQNNGFTIEAFIGEGADGSIYICTNDLGFLHIVKYTPTGTRLFSERIDLPPDVAYMFVRGFEVNTHGLIISTEYVDNVNYQYNIRGVKCNFNGDTLWTWRDNFSNTFWEGAGALTVDAAGNSYFLSQVMLDFYTSKFALTILSPAGGVIKTSIYGSGISNDRLIPHDVTLDNSGNIIVAAERSYTNSNNIENFEGLIVKYSAAGDSLWSKKIPGSSNVIPYNVQISGDNSIYIAGQYPMSSSSCQFIQKLAQSGDSLWNFNIQGVNYWQKGKVSNIDNSGNVYLFSERQNGIMITKFGVPIGIQNTGNGVPASFSLSQNYPNPFNPVTNIEFSIPKSSIVKLMIYDIQGKLVETIVNSELSPGTYKADWNAANYSSGVYFYKLESQGFTQTKRMLLIK